MRHVPPAAAAAVAQPAKPPAHLADCNTGRHWRVEKAFAERNIVHDARHAPAGWTLTPPADGGPAYPDLPELAKWRALAKARPLDGDETRAYGRAVGEAIRALQARELHASAGKGKCAPPRGGALRHEQILAGQIAAFHRAAAADRRAGVRADNGTPWTDEARRAEIARCVEQKRLAAAGVRASAAPEPFACERTALDRSQPAAGSPPIAATAAKRKARPMSETVPEAERALAWRKAQGLTRAQLAERLGFSASQIQDYEEGRRRGKTGALFHLIEHRA